MPNTYLFEKSTDIEKFSPRTTVVSCFIECEGKILVLRRAPKSDQAHLWCIPGGKMETGKDVDERAALAREILEETGLSLTASSFSFAATRFARIPGWDYTLHIYHINLDARANVQLSDEHVDMKWVSLWQFKSLNLLKGQDEAFDIVYKDRLWEKNNSSNFTLTKGNSNLCFNASKRLVINLIGTSGSGKGTQGQMLSQIYGLPHISIGDLFRDDLRNKTSLGKLIAYHDATDPNNYSPDEICLGIMTKRLAQADCINGFILDGFPRTAGQTEALIKLFLRPQDLHIPIYMDLSEEVIKNRIKDRYICPSCGHQVRGHDESVQNGYCPKEACSKVKLEHRPEDIDEKKLQRRFGIFRENRDGILKIILDRDPVLPVPLKGEETPFDVLAIVCGLIDKSFNNHLRLQAMLVPSSKEAMLINGSTNVEPSNRVFFLYSMYKKYPSSNKLLLATAGAAMAAGVWAYKATRPKP